MFRIRAVPPITAGRRDIRWKFSILSPGFRCGPRHSRPAFSFLQRPQPRRALPQAQSVRGIRIETSGGSPIRGARQCGDGNQIERGFPAPGYTVFQLAGVILSISRPFASITVVHIVLKSSVSKAASASTAPASKAIVRCAISFGLIWFDCFIGGANLL